MYIVISIMPTSQPPIDTFCTICTDSLPPPLVQRSKATLLAPFAPRRFPLARGSSTPRGSDGLHPHSNRPAAVLDPAGSVMARTLPVPGRLRAGRLTCARQSVVDRGRPSRSRPAAGCHPTAPRAAGIRRRSAPRRPASATIGRSTWPGCAAWRAVSGPEWPARRPATRLRAPSSAPRPASAAISDPGSASIRLDTRLQGGSQRPTAPAAARSAAGSAPLSARAGSPMARHALMARSALIGRPIMGCDTPSAPARPAPAAVGVG